MKLPSNIHVKAYGAEALVELTPEVRDLLTREDKFGGTYCMYRQDQPGQKYAYVPRGLVDRSKADTVQVSYRPMDIITPSVAPQTEEQGMVIANSLSLLKQGVDHIIEAPTGYGKCALKGETVLLHSGNLKKVEDVVVGDVLMGPDSTPRKVLSLGRGVTQAYELRTSRGEVLRFNEDHILCLEATTGGDFQVGTTVEVSLKDYLGWSNTRKHQFKLYKPSLVMFPPQCELTVSPYVLGLLLGDGCFKGRVSLTTTDTELVEAFTTECKKYFTAVYTNGISHYSSSFLRDLSGRPTNPFIDAVRVLGLMGTGSDTKFVPSRYRLGSVETRLQLIAGLMDSDGHLNGGCFDYITKSQQLAEDLCFLCWSVGLAAINASCTKVCGNTGATGSYYRVLVSGDTDKIPTRLGRKKAQPRRQKKSVLRHGFTVHDLGKQEYFGFHLDGDHKYLTGNFFVTHNTFVGAAVAGQLGQRTLIVVTKNDLTTSWRDTLTKFMGQTANTIGHVQQNVLKYENCPFTIAMIHTLVEREYNQEFYNSFGLLISDEVHRLGADYFAQVCSKFNSAHRLGLSATPERSDGKQELFQAHIGPVLVKGTWIPMSPKVLVKKTGVKLPMVWQRTATGKWIQSPMKVVPGRLAPVTKVLASDHSRNQEIVKFVKSSYDSGRNTVVMSDLIDGHLTPLFHLLVQAGISGEHIGYYHGQVKKENLEANKLKRVVLATYLMCGEGTNVEQWDTLVLATPRSNVKQAIGRVMRFAKGKKTPVVLELVDDNEVLKAFHFSRLKQYYSVKAEIVNM